MNNTITIEQLFPWEKEVLTNGCGGKGGIINPPELIFGKDCLKHDYRYWLGGSEEDRTFADNEFRDGMFKTVKKSFFLFRPHRYIIAQMYYMAVRLFGHKFFDYRSKQRNVGDLVYDIRKLLKISIRDVAQSLELDDNVIEQIELGLYNTGDIETMMYRRYLGRMYYLANRKS